MSGNTSTPVAAAAGVLLCTKCQQSISPGDREAFFCSSRNCKKGIHLKCCTGKTVKDADLARQPDTSFPFFCSMCAVKPRNRRNLNESISTAKLDDTVEESILREENTKLKDQNRKLIEKQAKYEDDINQLKIQMDALIAESRRKEDLRANKRLRTDTDETFFHDISGFPSTEALNRTVLEKTTTKSNNKTVIPEVAPSWFAALVDEVKRVSQRVSNIEGRTFNLRNRTPSPRRSSRSRDLKVTSNKVDTNKKTYAEIMANANRNPNTIRLIRVNDDGSRHCKEIMQSIQKDNMCVGEEITRITQKGTCNFSVTCGDAITAEKFEDNMNNKYGDSISITQPTINPPQVKITRLITDITDKNDILEQLLEQNRWMRDIEINADRNYIIMSYDQIEYTNIVLNTNLEGLKKMMEVGKVIFGLKTSRIYENINIFQCKRCQCLGHLHKGCIKEPICRICAKGHLTEQCTSTNLCCYNCKNAIIKSEGKLIIDTKHRASDDRCPQRKRKIEDIKRIISKQKN